jgi:hypothetical protein
MLPPGQGRNLGNCIGDETQRAQLTFCCDPLRFAQVLALTAAQRSEFVYHGPQRLFNKLSLTLHRHLERSAQFSALTGAQLSEFRRLTQFLGDRVSLVRSVLAKRTRQYRHTATEYITRLTAPFLIGPPDAINESHHLECYSHQFSTVLGTSLASDALRYRVVGSERAGERHLPGRVLALIWLLGQLRDAHLDGLALHPRNKSPS